MIERDKKVSALVLGISDEDCRRSDLTGGKGSSLAVLSSISQQFHNFTVPRGLVLTTLANDLFLIDSETRVAIGELTLVAGRNPPLEELRTACERCESIIGKKPIPVKVVEHLKTKLATYGDLSGIRFAVRSSAVGEDTQEISAAGQMKTFLGVPASDFDQILQKVAECWASQFGFTAVSYKRQHGQTIAGRMAVVIQEMVPSQVSGVMFTCDPETANLE